VDRLRGVVEFITDMAPLFWCRKTMDCHDRLCDVHPEMASGVHQLRIGHFALID